MRYSLDGRAAQQALPPDAALRPKIAGILKSDLGSIIFPIYHCGAGEAQCVGRPLFEDGMMHRAVSHSRLCQQPLPQECRRMPSCADVGWINPCGERGAAVCWSVPV